MKKLAVRDRLSYRGFEVVRLRVKFYFFIYIKSLCGRCARATRHITPL
ncbi:hypothetical protein HCDSEM_033 [Candidatus Hodgkinia cicadicola Dsem]|nr:hypothetical protein HCDSEM_033 [Candidatus Hodgkinia cicadicola Dsem]